MLEVLHKFKYRNVYITNLVPYYGTNSQDIAEFVKDKTKFIKEMIASLKKIKEVDKIFVAWGGRNGFERRFL